MPAAAHDTLCLLLLFFSLAAVTPTLSSSSATRRLLHQPLYPNDSIPPDGSSPSSTPTHMPFFPSYHHSPSTPPPSPTTPATFPANISSLLFPQPSSSLHHRPVVAIVVSLSLLSAALVVALLVFFIYYYHKRATLNSKASRSDSLRLYPPNTLTSDAVGSHHKPRSPSSTGAGAGTSSEFLYLGTVVNSRDACMGPSKAPYRKLGSPELKPLPPLPRQRNRGTREDDEDEEFFSPRGSSFRRLSPVGSVSGRILRLGMDKLGIGSRSFNSTSPSHACSNSGSLTSSPCLNSEPQRPVASSSPSSSPEINWNFPVSEQRTKDSEATIGKSPSPPPLPPPRFWESSPNNNDDTRKPKLKPLHWDKVSASSDRVMVWDQLRSGSFQLNEEMIETLFMVNNNNNNTSNFSLRDNGRRQIVAPPTLEYRVLDPKKSHNIAILLRALNVTVDEVCEALKEGNWDMLGTELLESLLKMAPNKDEECKLKEFNDESAFKLGPAENFLKIVLHIPFAFKRVDAMLYIANFDSESEFLRKSFETLEVACEELRNSRLFLKLLEAVLRTGNRMNVGTNRGEAHAFNLDTLLRLVDIKGADGKTSVLHFVVQEMVRIEGSRIAGATNRHHIAEPTLQDEVEFRKLRLQVVSGLSGELCNVKKAATMDSDMLSSDVSKLARGLAKVSEVEELSNGESTLGGSSSRKFSEAMKGFLKKGEEEIVAIQEQEKKAFCSVKKLTEYFHGDSCKEEAHPFRVFMVVRDFLSILDRVCKEVGKVNERTLVGFRHYSSEPSNTMLPPIFPEIVGNSLVDDDENSSRRSS